MGIDRVNISKEMVGLPEDMAREILESVGYSMRVIERDGVHYVVTRDHNPNRIDVVIEDGLLIDRWNR
jgi:hypothetical protein